MEEPCIVFTRYLYLKQEVKLALLASLLNKKDDALFWAYELYYSGFVYELFDTFFKIYYDFYAILNEPFETYLLKKTKDLLKNYNSPNRSLDHDRFIGSIIKNFLIRPFNTDIFMLQNICNIFDIDCECKNVNIQDLIRTWIIQNDYLNISRFVLYECNDLQPKDIYSIVLDAFAETGLQINKTKRMKNFTRSKIVNIDHKQVLLAKIMELFARKNALIMGKNKYVGFDISETILYETLEAKDGIKNYRILQNACKLGVNDEKYLSLFEIERNNLSNHDLLSIYNSSWAYYASWCPFWLERISSCHGKCDHMTKKVVFDDDDLFDAFHDNYDYETDEQPLFVKNKSVMAIDEKLSWSNFYERHKNDNLFKLDDIMLDELCQHKVKYVK